MKTVVTSSMEMGDKEIIIDGYVHYEIDRDYGSDADGNRGVKMIIVEDVTNISAYADDLGNIALTKEDIEKASNTLTREFLEN